MRDLQGLHSIIQAVTAMPTDHSVQNALQPHGLSCINVTWEDTARTFGSCWGPNITDMTLQVRDPHDSAKTYLLPVIRFPNFSDKTCDVPLEQVRVKVGNERGQALTSISLKDYLDNIQEYLSDKDTYNAESRPLLTESDTHVLVSAQACVLPLPASGTESVDFNPVLFNYQSRKDDPAVLAIMVTPDGTSATILNNSDDKAQWGQNVFHNNCGQKTCLRGERVSVLKERMAEVYAKEHGVQIEEARSAVSIADDVNLVMLIQVPLEVAPSRYDNQQLEFGDESFGYGGGTWCLSAASCDDEDDFTLSASSTFEDAAISHGEDEGKHIELGGSKTNRDSRFPIRITLQFYKATSNRIMSDQDLENISACITAVFEDASFVGSLVTGTLEQGTLLMGQARPTQPAPLSAAVISPPRDYLKVVNPFSSEKKPQA